MNHSLSSILNDEGNTLYGIPFIILSFNSKPTAWYRLKFADRIRKHMFNGGSLSPDRTKAIWLRRSNDMNLPIIAESARWGDYRRDVDSGRWNSSQFDLYTRDEHYLKDQQWIFNTYFPRRTGVVLSQLRARGLYPETESPDFSQHGGQVPSEFPLGMNNPNAGGTIYYTLDGSDPRISDTEPEENLLVPEKTSALNTEISDAKGKKIGPKSALFRSFNVCFRGCGLIIFPFVFICPIISYFSLTKRNTTSWDNTQQTKVYHGDLSALRIMGAVLRGSSEIVEITQPSNPSDSIV